MLFRAATATLVAIVLTAATPAATAHPATVSRPAATAKPATVSRHAAAAVAAITRALDLFNKGDSAAFFAAHTADALIIDEFAPYRWEGLHAAEKWAADYDRDARARGITNGHVDYGTPIRAEMAEGRAYIVLPTVYRFKQKGVMMREAGTMTFVMAQLGEGWKISSWTWSGPPPSRGR